MSVADLCKRAQLLSFSLRSNFFLTLYTWSLLTPSIITEKNHPECILKCCVTCSVSFENQGWVNMSVFRNDLNENIKYWLICFQLWGFNIELKVFTGLREFLAKMILGRIEEYLVMVLD